jgi:hypothetical protein
MFKIFCPNSKEHNRFSVCAHIIQKWEVDGDSDYIDTLEDCVEVSHYPSRDNSFTCLACGAQAKTK